MKLLLFFLSLIFMLPTANFKSEHLKFSRVATAYVEKESKIQANLKKHKISPAKLNLYVRAFKEEQEIELWAKEKEQQIFKLIAKYPICALSGFLGPKRRQGDGQIPEGFYNIDGFNPNSNYYLSLHVNYPNPSDRILGYKPALGNLIFIHGDCVTIGCLPLTDDLIKEFYVYCVEARESGQETIPLTIFPARLTNPAFAKLKTEFAGDTDKLNLWTDLKAGYDYFEKQKKLPTITFLANGRHRIK